MNLEAMLEYVNGYETIRQTILMNSNHEDGNWNPSMCSVASIVGDEFDTDIYADDDFAGLWEATCEIIRRDNPAIDTGNKKRS